MHTAGSPETRAGRQLDGSRLHVHCCAAAPGPGARARMLQPPGLRRLAGSPGSAVASPTVTRLRYSTQRRHPPPARGLGLSVLQVQDQPPGSFLLLRVGRKALDPCPNLADPMVRHTGHSGNGSVMLELNSDKIRLAALTSAWPGRRGMPPSDRAPLKQARAPLLSDGGTRILSSIRA